MSTDRPTRPTTTNGPKRGPSLLDVDDPDGRSFVVRHTQSKP